MAEADQPSWTKLTTDIQKTYGSDAKVKAHLKLFNTYLSKNDFKEARKQATLIHSSIMALCNKQRSNINANIKKGLQQFLDFSDPKNLERVLSRMSSRSDDGPAPNVVKAPTHEKKGKTMTEKQIIDAQTVCLDWFANAIFDLHECLTTLDSKPYSPAACPSAIKPSEQQLKKIMQIHNKSRDDATRAIRSEDEFQKRTNRHLTVLRDSIKQNQLAPSKGKGTLHYNQESDNDIIKDIEHILQTKFQELSSLKILPSKINELKCDIEQGAYAEHSNKPSRPDKRPGLDDISEIRHLLKERQAERKQMYGLDNMTAVEKEIQKLKNDIDRNQYEKGYKEAGTEQMFEDIKSIRSTLNSRQTERKSDKTMDEIRNEIAKLKDEVKSGNFEGQYPQKNGLVFENIREIRDILKTKEEETTQRNITEIQIEIGKLKDDVNKGQFDAKDPKMTGSVFDDIREIKQSLKQRKEANNDRFENMAAVETEIQNLKNDIELDQYEKGYKVSGKGPMFEHIKYIRSTLNSRQSENKSDKPNMKEIQIEIGRLKDDIKKGIFDAKDPKTKGSVFDDIIEIRQNLKKREEANKDRSDNMAAIENEIKTLKGDLERNQFVNGYKVTGKGSMFEDITYIRSTLNSRKTKDKSDKIMDELQKQIKKLKDEVKSGIFDEKYPTKNGQGFEQIAEIRHILTQKEAAITESMDEIKKQIEKLKDEVKSGKFDGNYQTKNGLIFEQIRQIRELLKTKEEATTERQNSVESIAFVLENRALDLYSVLTKRPRVKLDYDTVVVVLRAVQDIIERCTKEAEPFATGIEDIYKTIFPKERLPESVTETCQRIKKQINRSEREKQQLHDDIGKLDAQLQETERERVGLLNRLSKIAGAKLTDGNSAIADLSDTNRPTKLAERFSELYDNQWTDVFGDLHDKYKKSEQQVVKILLETVQDAYMFCDEISKKQNSNLKTTLLFPVPREKSSIDKKKEYDNGPLATPLGPVHTKMISDLRKQTADESVKDVIRHFIDTQKALPADKNCTAYINECIKLCWLMCLQSPPVFVDVRVGEKFDKDKFKPYTKSGKRVAFLVWPPLYLEKDGAILGKGVAQGK